MLLTCVKSTRTKRRSDMLASTGSSGQNRLNRKGPRQNGRRQPPCRSGLPMARPCTEATRQGRAAPSTLPKQCPGGTQKIAGGRGRCRLGIEHPDNVLTLERGDAQLAVVAQTKSGSADRRSRRSSTADLQGRPDHFNRELFDGQLADVFIISTAPCRPTPPTVNGHDS